ncbi:thiol:disulfide interchange protein DsbA [Legionella beliardensis]|uniref:Thiol:disulfide interchange protein n=1 Tax=Legionella beliardensis TaxID=91822 RepID=A0A378HYN9_9GAMM|nr:thiol:disulfide interchange protein DsbA/DsbL [Legionella beliardensis]STX27651.1 thiol:disulfide interchange protein DsbA [Legionella beliardensis]
MLKRLLVLFLLFPMLARAEDFVAGKDYEVINSSHTPANKVLVTEFFSFGCPWCYRIEATLNQWAKQQDKKVQFSRVPVIFNKDWAYYAKAYYTADLLNMSDKLNPLLFKAIQVDKTPLNTDQAMVSFFTNQGIDKDTAESAFTHSTTVDMKINEGNAQMARFHINVVPSFIINGQYKTDLQMAQSEERLVKILDYLVNKSTQKQAS